ncbi:helix-turn-helix transcriptional regulator [Caulobacter sp.]|uniref:response regulator transcription factor n=1 Tax=Caulobacter sp. TaxID=78 RepID=UPI0031DA4F0F
MIERLTERERQILELAARHLTSKEIGPLLGIRPASVDTFMQAIIRKLGVAGRKQAVIAYLAATSARTAVHRDDLDFGSSPVSAPDPSPPTASVVGDGDHEPLPASSHPSSAAEAETWGAHAERMRPRTGRWVRWGLGSPARRLVAVAIAAMVLGLVTLGAVAVGAGLNRAFDRMLDDHVSHPNGRSGRSQSTHDAEFDRGARRQAAVFS